MDPFLRGISEHFVDKHLEEDELKNMKAIVNIFRLGIKSRVDAEIGFFLGHAYAELLMQFLILNDRLPNKEETLELFNLMKRRFPEILSVIKSAKNTKLMEREDEVESISELDIGAYKPVQSTE